jgi:hypothetical protein
MGRLTRLLAAWLCIGAVLAACSNSTTSVSPPDVWMSAETQVSVDTDSAGDDPSLSDLNTSSDLSPVDMQVADPGPLPIDAGPNEDTEPFLDLCADVNCDDGDACTGVESCEPSTGKCLSGQPITCDDGDPCNGLELCAPATGKCVAVDVIECNDGDACNGVETCDSATGTCVPGDMVICDDEDACNGLEVCDSITGECVKGDPVLCDDGDACNGLESCTVLTGACALGTPVVCDDGDGCNGLETCVSATGKCLVGEIVKCDDGDACNGLETCISATGTCLQGEPIQCGDGNACNGIETCDPTNGLCLDGSPVECDDNDGCNGVEICNELTGACETIGVIGACPLSPKECDEDGELYGPDGAKSVEAASSDMIRLRDAGTTAEKLEIIQALKSHPSVEAASYSELLSDLNRKGDEVDWVLGVECFGQGYKFNSSDNWVEHWWPQGMSGSATGQSVGSPVVEGHNIHLVSWYHKPEEDGSTDTNKGMRLSFVRRTSFDAIRYRNILMVEPMTDDDGTPNFKPVVGHAGGIVWYKNLLYVADTTKGFRVFDMNHLMKVQNGNKDLIGYQAGSKQYQAFNYSYVLPMVNRYKLCEGSCCARFSFCSIDMSVSPPRIIAGEYSDANSNGRLHGWDIDEASGWLAMDPGQDTATADSLFYPAAIRMQGATTYNGITYVSSSNPKSNWPQTPGTLYVTSDGNKPVKRGYPTLPEDLYHDHFSEHLWTVTEYPGLRYVFSVHRSDALLGCN